MGAYLSESFVGGAGHIHAVKIMYLAVLYHFAINIMVEFVIITLVAGHWKNAALCQTGKQGRKAPVLWWNDPKQPER